MSGPETVTTGGWIVWEGSSRVQRTYRRGEVGDRATDEWYNCGQILHQGEWTGSHVIHESFTSHSVRYGLLQDDDRSRLRSTSGTLRLNPFPSTTVPHAKVLPYPWTSLSRGPSPCQTRFGDSSP